MNNFWNKCIHLPTQLRRQPDNVVADVQRSMKNNNLLVHIMGGPIQVVMQCLLSSPVNPLTALFIVYYSVTLCVPAVFVSFYRCVTKISFFFFLPSKPRSVSSQVKGHHRITDQPSPQHQWSHPRSLSLPQEKADQGASHQKGRTSLSFPHQALSEPTSLKRFLNVKIQVNFDSRAVSFRYQTILLRTCR